MAGGRSGFWAAAVALLMFGTVSGCAAKSGDAYVVLENPPANAVVVEQDFGDVPRYPGATMLPAEEVPLVPGEGTGEWAEWKVAAYNAGDPADEVVAFYEQQMPDQGWSGRWARQGDGTVGTFSKDKTAATLSIAQGAKATLIVVVRSVHR